MERWCLVLAVVVVIVACGCMENGITGKAVSLPAGSYVNVTVGVPVTPMSTLLYVAKDKGFFEEEGVNVDMVEFSAGKLALQAFLAGSLDLAATGEVPLVYAAMNGNRFYVITQLVEKTQNNIRIVALRDENSGSPGEYFKAKKRRIATSIGGGPEFYVYNFMKKYNITDVELINQNPGDMPAALSSGSVDAIAVFDPFAFFAEKKLGEKAVSFIDGGVYNEFFVLDAHRDWTESNPEAARKIMRGLAKAAAFIRDNPEESKAIMMKYTKLDNETASRIWGNFVFKPALNGMLLNNMNAEATWAANGTFGPKGGIPDFREYVYADALREVMPDAVSL
jgi:ABC-type nitrate/sulfonate/bicarbonate transport system substrate-binding protein